MAQGDDSDFPCAAFANNGDELAARVGLYSHRSDRGNVHPRRHHGKNRREMATFKGHHWPHARTVVRTLVAEGEDTNSEQEQPSQ
jgi:hypothetical protein